MAQTSTRSPPSCQVCFQTGHNYRNCEHPTILQTHEITLELFKRSHIANTHNRYHITDWINHLTRGMARILLLRYAPDTIKHEYSSIQLWRARDHIQGEVNSIPRRIGVISHANKQDISTMINIMYTHFALSTIHSTSSLYSAYVTRRNSVNIHNVIRGYTNNIRNQRITHDGFRHYTTEIIRYLQTSLDTFHTQNRIPTEIEHDNMVPVFNPTFYLRDVLTPLQQVTIPRPPQRISYSNHKTSYTLNIHYSDNNIVIHPDTPISCGICWENHNTHDNIMKTNCNHHYCIDCVMGHLKASRQQQIASHYSRTPPRWITLHCPMCRQDVDTITHKFTHQEKIEQIEKLIHE